MHIMLNGLDVLVIFILFSLCLNARSNVRWWIRIWLFLCVWIVQVFMSTHFFHQAYTSMLYSVLIIFLTARILYGNSLKEISFMTLLLGTFFFISEVAAYGIFSLAGFQINFTLHHDLLIVLSVLSRLLNIGVVTGFCLLYLRYGLYNVKAEQSFSLLTILLPVPLLICYSTLQYSPYVKNTVSSLFWICFISLLLALYYVILLLIKLIQNHKYAIFEEMSKRMCDRLEHEIDAMAGFQHDFRHHLRAIQSEDAVTYAAELEAELPRRIIYTGNFIFDQIIADEKKQHSELDIRITGKLPKMLPGIKAVHLVSLFGNMLENAVHAVLELDGEQIIRLHTDFDGYSLVIRMENAYIDSCINTDGQGLGIKNMRSVVTRYDGRLETRQKEGVFIVNALLQMKG